MRPVLDAGVAHGFDFRVRLTRRLNKNVPESAWLSDTRWRALDIHIISIIFIKHIMPIKYTCMCEIVGVWFF